VDNDQKKIEALRAGQMPIYEPGLEEMVVRNKDGRAPELHDRSPRRGPPVRRRLHRGGHPPKDTGETISLTWRRLATQIGRSMDRYKVVVNKSTVPVGTGEFVRESSPGTSPAPSTSTWSPIPSSCARAPPSRTRSAPTGS